MSAGVDTPERIRSVMDRFSDFNDGAILEVSIRPYDDPDVCTIRLDCSACGGGSATGRVTLELVDLHALRFPHSRMYTFGCLSHGLTISAVDDGRCVLIDVVADDGVTLEGLAEWDPYVVCGGLRFHVEE